MKEFKINYLVVVSTGLSNKDGNEDSNTLYLYFSMIVSNKSLSKTAIGDTTVSLSGMLFP
jgi:hypothetical protein